MSQFDEFVCRVYAPPMLQAKELKKSFGRFTAVDGVSLEIKPGESVGLLGPNGAGKTTTISMLTGLLPPDSGSVLVQGEPIRSDIDPKKKVIGLVPQEIALYEELSAQDNLEFFGSLYGLSGKELQRATDEALDIVQLRDRRKDPVKDFSGGMKRRINLAAALLHHPKLIILDEPTVGVDPQSRNAIFENIEALKTQGLTVLYTTHYMEEVERLCQRVIIIDRGKVIADDTLPNLYKKLPARNLLHIELNAPPPQTLQEQLKGQPFVRSLDTHENTLKLGLQSLQDCAAALQQLEKETIIHIETVRPNLETVFLTLTGKTLRDQ